MRDWLDLLNNLSEKSLGKQKVNEQQLYTLLVETEAVINRRPLVYVEDDINSRALSPSDFISMNYKVGTPDIEVEYVPEETSADVLVKIWKKGQSRLNEFWKSWSNQYLQSLRERHTLLMKSIKGEVPRNPCIGEVVIIKDEDIPRGRWKIARVVSLIDSDVDKQPRAANLVTSNGRNLKRPFRSLYPLEYTNDREINDDERDINDSKVMELPKERPTRAAATKARQKIRSIATASFGEECR